MPPYLPFLEALDAHIRLTPLDQLRKQAGPHAVTLNSLFPALGVRLGDLPAAYALPSEQARLRLYEAVGTFLASIAEHQPVVLMLDDLQWADPASLDMLCYVASHHPAARLLIVGACRAGEAGANPALGKALDRLNRYRVLTALSLPPLSAEDIGSIAASYLPGAIDPAVTSLLYTHSEGNPFFAEELLRGWMDIGGLDRKDGT
jgi:predicted ATPase